MLRHLPNALTLLRLALVPVVWKLLWDRAYERAIVVGFFTTITDALDGWLARKLKAESRLGAYLDPIADKVLLMGSYLIFGLDHVIPWWLTAAVLGRDIVILGFAVIARLFTRLRDFPPTVWGKLSTFVQIITGLVILINGSMGADIYTYKLQRWFVWICLGTTLWSGLHYVWTGIRMWRNQARVPAVTPTT